MDDLFSGCGTIKLDAPSLFNEVPDKDEADESVQEKGKSANFPNRPPITYTPTSNDSNTLPGFDLTSGNEWHYPVGVELRTYQFVIAERCLYQNCLVCVPTGLGKTLIAAVVLHNFLRWYPTGCVIFMAPTRPLVSQQMAACRDFTGLSISGKQTDVAVELTGTTSPQQRAALWNGPHRAFFLTPQIIVNDLATGICPATSIRCVVIDEAHKATGNHAYCQVIRSITGTPYNHRQFRVVALSATPASDLLGAQAVIANLLIAHLEVRTESSPDVREYCHRRAIETIVVCLDPQLSDFKKRLCDLAHPPFQRLCEHKALWAQNPKRRPHPEAFAPFTLVKAREAFTRSHSSSPFFGVVLRDFRLATCFARALQLLTQYGLRPVYQYLLTNIGSSIELAQVSGLQEFITDLGSALGVTETTSVMSQLPLVAGHPKLLKLRDVLIEHFSGASERCQSQLGTRAIVFTQYRDSVSDIMHMLKAYSPTLRPAVFVGQSSSSSSEDQHNSKKRNTQRDQLQVMEMFREGRVNILISTCIGEEGLDVGQVDLIVCFDAPRSPARLIQRLGRTGRKRSGRVVVLLTRGREQANFALSMARSNTVHDALLQGQATQKLVFYPHNPRMVPLGVNPSPVLWEPSIHSKIDTFANHNAVANCRKRYPTPPPNLRFPVFEASALLSLGQEGAENKKTFTQRYSVNRWIPSIRESFQTEFSGPSTTTWHLVASLRLLELHRRGQTHAMYHAMGIRKVDMISSLSDLPLSMAQFTQATLGGPVELSLPPASQDLPKPTPLVGSSIRFFSGLVSKSLMVDPRIHVFGELNLPDVVPIRGITSEDLDKGLEGMIASGIAPSTHGCQPTIRDSAFGLPMLLSSASSRPPSPVNPPPAKKLHTMTSTQEAALGVSNAIDGLQPNLKLRLSDDLDDFLNSC